MATEEQWQEMRKEYETTGFSLRELAQKYGIKYSSAKSRRQRQGWERNASIPASKETVDAATRPGAPLGNKNAVGNKGGSGGPPGNKKAVFTGEFETIWMDCLSEEERQLCKRIDTGKLAQVEDAIRLLSLREHRMMERIRIIADGLSERERKVWQERKMTKGEVLVKDPFTNEDTAVVISVPNLVVTSVEETQRRKIDDILRIEEAMTRIQDKKTRLLALKHTLETSDKPDETTNAEEHARRVLEAWAKRG